MSPTDFESKAGRLSAPDRPCDDPSLRARLQKTPLPAIPPDFARRMQQRIESLAEQSRFEQSLLVGMLLLMAVGGAMFAADDLYSQWTALRLSFGQSLPWLGAAVAAIGAALLADQALQSLRMKSATS